MPVQLQRAMAAEAEAAREARAKVVAAEGEQKASIHLKEAALVLEESTSALQLIYLQVKIGNSVKIIFNCLFQTINAISKVLQSYFLFQFTHFVCLWVPTKIRKKLTKNASYEKWKI